MRILLALLIAAAAPALAASGDATQVIPEQFHGEWHTDTAFCGDGEDESFLYIEPHRVTYYESAGSVKAAVVRERELALILELSGEGETWLTTAQFELSPDANALTSRVVPGEEYIRYRCPGPH